MSEKCYYCEGKGKDCDGCPDCELYCEDNCEEPTCPECGGDGEVSTPNKLKPCPFCGCPDIKIMEDFSCFVSEVRAGSQSGSTGWKPRCLKCGGQHCWWHSEEEAIKAWNRRVS